MAFTESQIEAVKILVEHYGDIHSWEIDHWKNYHLLIEAMADETANKYNLNNDDDEAAVYKKENQKLTLEADKLFAIAKKVQHVEGLKPDEKFFVAKKLMEDGLKLLQDRIDNPQTLIRKKPVGRPSAKIIYQWMDYLVSELGSNTKAAKYASNSPMTDSKKPASLLREYRRYCAAKGED
jgi:hypothetical protein